MTNISNSSMEGFTIGLRKQLDYVKKVLSDRNTDTFDISLKTPLFPGEPTGLEVFIHGVSSLFWAAQKLLHPDKDDQEFALSLTPESDKSLMEQMINVYQKAIDTFTDYLGTITEADLETKIPSPFARTTGSGW